MSMREIVLSIPEWEEKQNLEIEVRINGQKKTITYRVEVINWEGTNPTSEEKVTSIKHAINENEKNWQLMQIGSPTETGIPLTFRHRS